MSAAGHRCDARRFLEFDHVEPVARGGRATVEGLRLRCRAHNQYEAERLFGAGFMSERRRVARLARAEAREKIRIESMRRSREETQIREIQNCLRNLGCRAEEARRAAEHAAAAVESDAGLEQGIRAALGAIGLRAVVTVDRGNRASPPR